VTKRTRLGAAVAATAFATLLAGAADATPLPRPRPAEASAPKAPRSLAASPAQTTASIPLPPKRSGKPSEAAEAFAQATIGLRGSLIGAKNLIKPLPRPVSGPWSLAATNATPPADIAAVKRVIEFTRKGKQDDADATAKSITDPVARKLAEWVFLRSDNTKPPFQRYFNFISANPAWPHVPMFRRRAENALWNDKLPDSAVLSFYSTNKSTTAKGRIVSARALLAQGKREEAEALVRYAWREDELSADVERQVLEMFGTMLTPADHRYRMAQRFYLNDTTSGMRAAQRLGASDQAIAKAWEAVLKKAGNAKALLDAVPATARNDAGYLFARAMWLRKNDQPAEAGALMLSAPNDPALLVDLDQWWIERRLLIRKLIDENEIKTAYRLARDFPEPPKGNYRVDKHFMAGWIALRFMNDPAAAASHFAKINEGTNNPHALGRGGYWQGRAAEAMGKREEARKFYEAAAQHSAVYYGQLARARLGLPELGLREPPQIAPDDRGPLNNLEVVRAVEILYALDERDLIAPIFAELGESANDLAGMAVLAETAHRYKDGRAMLLLGKAAHSRGLPMDFYAFPTVGLPDYEPLAPPVESAVTYSIARQESHFNQKVVSPANAMGLMQVTPAAGIDTAKKFKFTFSKEKLLSDPVYNVQVGAGELANLINGYRGSYILTFAGYNAGRGRVRQWIAAHGDPRDANVDPVDWVEKIPIAETRNYVQRIMENLQVYRVKFGGGARLQVEADLRRDLGGN